MLLYKLLLLELGSHVIASGIFESKYQHTLEYFIIVSLFCLSLFVHLLKQQIQKRYKQLYMSQLLLISLLSACWYWWCWRCWRGPGAQWWGAPCAQEPHQGGSGNLSRRPSLSCRRGDTRWWCSVTPSGLKSFQIQLQSSCLQWFKSIVEKPLKLQKILCII